MVCAKLSWLAFLYTLTPVAAYKRASAGVAIFVVAYGLTALLPGLFQCNLSKPWDWLRGSCIDRVSQDWRGHWGFRSRRDSHHSWRFHLDGLVELPLRPQRGDRSLHHRPARRRRRAPRNDGGEEGQRVCHFLQSDLVSSLFSLFHSLSLSLSV